MDEYAAGVGANYSTSEPLLTRGVELLNALGQDLERMAASSLHELLRCWEVRDRYWCAQAHARHMLFREETRWPGYYRRSDFPALDDANWKCFVNSRQRDGRWEMSKRPCLHIVD